MRTIYIGVYAALLSVSTVVNVTAHRCKFYESAEPYGGKYCIGEGTTNLMLQIHQCQYMCLQSETCKAYNYNVTENMCTRFTSPCPQAFSDPTMEYVVFRITPINQCYEWVKYSSRDSLDERMIATDTPIHIVARLQVNGNDVVSYFVINDETCYGTLVDTEYNSHQGHQCERLRVVEGCTIFWVPYTAGRPLPPNAVIGGVLANGDVPYVVKFDIIYKGAVQSISGHYIEGGPHAISGYAETRYSTTMMMMVVL